MEETIVVIGANHGGTAVLNTILDQFPGKRVVAFDRNSNISFLGCGMALWIGGQISGPEGLFYSSKEAFEEKGAVIHMETEVTRIDFDGKAVYARGKGGEDFVQEYDKLILATGSVPLRPEIEGMELDNVQFVKLYQNARDVIEKLKDTSVKKVAVVGAGYIGVELAEAFKRNGREVVLIDLADTCLSGYYDREFSDRMAHNLQEHGVKLAFGEKVVRLEGGRRVERVVTDQRCYEADMVVFGIGFKPNTALGQGRLRTFGNGAFLVDRRQETSVPGVYAVGTALRFTTMPYRPRIILPWLPTRCAPESSRPITRAVRFWNPWEFRAPMESAYGDFICSARESVWPGRLGWGMTRLLLIMRTGRRLSLWRTETIR